MKNLSRPALGALMLTFGFAAARVSAQEPLQRIKDLYSSAAYEAALTAASNIEASDADLEIEQYRILCLVALGRSDDAERTVERVLSKRPLYRPLAADTPPRIQEMFTGVRQRLGPSIAKTMYVDGKAAFDRKDRPAAVRMFEDLMRLADDSDLHDDPAIAEIRVLAAGFLTLSRALPARAEEAPADAIAAVAPVARALPPPAVAPVVEPPVPVNEVLPKWAPSDGASRGLAVQGAVRLSIDIAGSVAAVDLLQSVHPGYDALLLRAAKKWTYRPARVNGKAVPSERIVKVRFRAEGQ